VITEIDADSPAEKAGLREGDVIQEANKQPVKNAKDLVAISKKLKANEKILQRVYSQGPAAATSRWNRNKGNDECATSHQQRTRMFS
jgi:S1-C subfamily serine protease